MHRVKLDDIDCKILENLQNDGRITNVELAEKVGITAPPCLRRVRALEEAGYIQGYHAELNAESMGFGLTVFAMVGLHSQAESDLMAFEERVAEWPLVRETYMLNGEIDFILKIVARDLAQFQNFLTTKLTPAPNVDSVKTSLSIRCAKKLHGVPVGNVEE
ncbi:MAG: Lrp/AsnC family transcriptional regulator [Emcibacter sp.]|nr:Lrp/AsnC family transcriptional regulator [Emcibacter sp.]